MAVEVQVTFDAADPEALGSFWIEALAYIAQPPPDGHVTWADFLESLGVPEALWHDTFAAVDPDGIGPRLLFQRVPEGKTAKNRVHLDVNAAAAVAPPDRAGVVRVRAAELIALGATELQVVAGEEGPDSFWIVMADPEGNEFCLQ